jgi:hypothetical protein
MNKNEKKAYLPAEIKIVPLNAGDLLTTSGNDGFDNWKDDIFSEPYL